MVIAIARLVDAKRALRPADPCRFVFVFIFGFNGVLVVKFDEISDLPVTNPLNPLPEKSTDADGQRMHLIRKKFLARCPGHYFATSLVVPPRLRAYLLNHETNP